MKADVTLLRAKLGLSLLGCALVLLVLMTGGEFFGLVLIGWWLIAICWTRLDSIYRDRRPVAWPLFVALTGPVVFWFFLSAIDRFKPIELLCLAGWPVGLLFYLVARKKMPRHCLGCGNVMMSPQVCQECGTRSLSLQA